MPEPALALLAGHAEALRALGVRGYLVGGVVRDALRGQLTTDIDLIVEPPAGERARALARARGGSPFPLSERHGAWRIVDGVRTYDLTEIHPDGLEADLRRRDFTVDAIAYCIEHDRIVDPLGGRADLENEVLRVASETALADDPLRLLRLVRIATDLRLNVDPTTAALARAIAPRADEPARERTMAELDRLLRGRDPAGAVFELERFGMLEVLLPEVAALRGVEQSGYHHLDVLDHTRHVLDRAADVAAEPAAYLGDELAAALAAELAAELDGEHDGRSALLWAALLHDIDKPATRITRADGRIGFPGHAESGARRASQILGRLRGSAALRKAVARLVREHLRLGFLADERPLPARQVHRFAVATDPYPMLAIALSLADRSATVGDLARGRHFRRHHAVAVEMAAALAARHVPEPLVRGDEMRAILGIASGPLIGTLVAGLAEEQAACAVTTRDEAIAFLRAAAAGASQAT